MYHQLAGVKYYIFGFWLRRILEIYEEQLHAADKDDISYTDFVTRLVRAQWQAKQEGALEWRIRRANLPER